MIQLRLFFVSICLILLVSCKKDSHTYVYRPITTNLEKKVYEPKKSQSVTMITPPATSSFEDSKAIAASNRVNYYTKAFKNTVYYADASNCIILTTPNEKGKGQGIIGELGGILPTFYDFHYTIDLENFDEDEIRCEMDKYNSTFTIELKGKSIYFRTKGELEILHGEKDEKGYQSFLERVDNINKGKEVYGNPKYRITFSSD